MSKPTIGIILDPEDILPSNFLLENTLGQLLKFRLSDGLHEYEKAHVRMFCSSKTHELRRIKLDYVIFWAYVPTTYSRMFVKDVIFPMRPKQVFYCNGVFNG